MPERVEYRYVREDELPLTTDIFIVTANDMSRRYGFPVSTMDPEPITHGAGHNLRTGVLRGAFAEGRMVAYSGAIVRENHWFLTSFWTLPEFQGRGIGQTLLDQVWQKDAATHFVWSSPDITAIALYMRKGMLPVTQLITFSRPARDITADPPSELLEATPLSREAAGVIDQAVLGWRRDVDHEWWNQQPGTVSMAFLCDGLLVGYAYIRQGAIGPVLWQNPVDAPTILRAVIAASPGTPSRLTVPGLNHDAIRWLLEQGFKIERTAHLLSSTPLGRLDQYIPSGAALF